MNTATDILVYADQHQIHLAADNGKLILEAPDGALTDEFLQRAKQHKAELLKAIEDRRTSAQKLIESACKGLEITPAQFTTLCSEEDLEYIRNGSFSIETLRAYASSFAEGIRTRRIVFHPITEELIQHN